MSGNYKSGFKRYKRNLRWKATMRKEAGFSGPLDGLDASELADSIDMEILKIVDQTGEDSTDPIVWERIEPQIIQKIIVDHGWTDSPAMRQLIKSLYDQEVVRATEQFPEDQQPDWYKREYKAPDTLPPDPPVEWGGDMQEGRPNE